MKNENYLKDPKKTEPVIKVELPEVQKVEITNPAKTPHIQKVEVINGSKPTEIQKVKVLNFPPIKPVSFPKTQDVKVGNFPNEQKVRVVNSPVIPPFPKSIDIGNLPIGHANIPGEADPEWYIPVRLTNGERFYKALENAMAAAGGSSSNSSSVGNNVQNGQTILSVSNTATQLSTGRVMNGVLIGGLSTNSASVYIGNSSVKTTTGFELTAGQTTSLAINDLSKVYVIGTSGDGVCFLTTN